MRFIVAYSVLYVVLGVEGGDNDNETVTYEPAARQLYDFGLAHEKSIGIMTRSSGIPAELRDLITTNSDQASNNLLFDTMFSTNGEKIPERTFFAKGAGAFGYFEVTHDVSKYTYADVFHGVGKKTPAFVRFSSMLQGHGGSDVNKDYKGMAVKFYTKQGNLDLLACNFPVFGYRVPNLFAPSPTHAFKRNPKTNLFDFNSIWDITSLIPVIFHAVFWIVSDYGSPASYRNMDGFPIHTYELVNEHGETHYVRFSFRTEQGLSSLTAAGMVAVQSVDLDYYIRDLYNNIKNKNYPAWRLEMDVMTKQDLLKIDYDPFDVTRLWKNGTFVTVQIGRLVLNKNVDNYFNDVEQAAFNPGNLVPGIPGPVDQLFKYKYNIYEDASNYRLGRNHNKILVNMPLYAKSYNRDGQPPTSINGRDAPSYYPNSFNGAMPYVDEKKQKMKLVTLESNAVDLEPAWYFYNYILRDDTARQRFVDTVALTLVKVTPPVLPRVLKMFSLIDPDLESRVRAALVVARALASPLLVQSPATPATRVTNVMNHQAGHKY